MNKYITIISISIAVMLIVAGCGEKAGKNEEPEAVVEDFDLILNDQRTQVIVRDEASPAVTEPESEPEAAEEMETATVIAYADRIAGEQSVTYDIETALYEDGVVRVEYPQLINMTDGEKQQRINDNIRKAVTETISTDNLSSYDLKFETATKGAGMVSFIFRGIEFYANSAYPNNIVKTLNIDLDTEKNVRLKDYADMAYVVSCLELADGYTIRSEGIDKADFSAYLNNGAVTDYAITLLDYDIDLGNAQMIPAGFSALRDNHLVLFIRAEHAMGDYVELEFDKQL